MRRCVIFGGGELKDIRFTQSLLREDDYIVARTAATPTVRRWGESRT